MSGIYNIILEPSKQNLEVQLEFSTTVSEIFDYINTQYKISNTCQSWTCYSSNRQKYLTHQETIGQFPNDTLIINTYVVTQISNTNLSEIILFINITDGFVKKSFQAKFNESNTLEDIASSILAYCQLPKDLNIATADLFIFNQPYNDQIKRGKTLTELQIKDNLTIEAKIRWIGGNDMIIKYY
ncbi:unnamed protein product [Paramecium sonneborni]|uniref:Uncharacterized protein n=1 Tax=Paramecium sonneborni TaxID=65129 RepID=A0A8S1MKA8_9CILI|nr:unnamed protein product [Paramecium sonneborni]